MITDLRWVERQMDKTGMVFQLILQAHDGHTWFDVPTVKEN